MSTDSESQALREKVIRKLEAMYEAPHNRTKNSRAINSFILIAARRRWATRSQLARIFRVSHNTITVLVNVNSKYYNKIHDELDRIGLKAFEEKYFDQELADRVSSFVSEDRAKRRLAADRGRKLWFACAGDRYEVWFDDKTGQWFYALHPLDEPRSKRHYGPCSTYEEIVELMVRDEAFAERQ
jgi:serine/threonine protein phosphatase PrpC